MDDKRKSEDGFIPQHGGYKKLLTFKKAEIIYDGTVYFCNKFLKKNQIEQLIK